MAAPTYFGAGAAVTGTTAGVSVAWPANHQVNDVGFLIVESSGNSAAMATPSGWNAVSTSVTDVATIAGSRLHLFWRRATSTAEANVTTGAQTDHQIARIYVFRGCVTSGNPWNQGTAGSNSTASTTITLPFLNPTINDTLVAFFIGRPNDSSSTTEFSPIVNSTLMATAEAAEAGTITGNGGGFTVTYGTKLYAGDTGASTVAHTVSTTYTFFGLALAPAIPTQPTTRNLQQYDDFDQPIAIGGSILASPVRLHFDVSTSAEAETADFDPAVEVETTATTFDNVATVSGDRYHWDPDMPRGRRGSFFVYDSLRKRFIMGFGAKGSTYYTDVFELKMPSNTYGRSKWKILNVKGTIPTQRYYTGGVYDPTNDRVIMAFGYSGSDTNLIHTLKFSTDNPDGEWIAGTWSGTAPAARSNVGHAMGWLGNNAAVDNFYLVGGWGASYYNDVFSIAPTTAGGTTFAATTLKANGTAGNMSGRRNHLVVRDTNSNRLIIFGGHNGTTVLNDVWQFDLGTNNYTQLTPSGTAPVARELHSGYYDPDNDRMVYWSGWDGTNYFRSGGQLDLSTTNGTWTDLTGTELDYLPLASYGHVGALDTLNKIVVFWGGVDSSADNVRRYTALSSNATGNLVFYGLIHNNFPRPMDAAAFHWNPDRSELMIAGGYQHMPDNTTIADGGHGNDFFSYDLTNNSWRNPGVGNFTFHLREGALLIYDTIRDRYLLFGGFNGNGANTSFNDLWEAKANLNGDYKWTRLNPTGTKPGVRWLMTGAFDPVNDRLVLWGGTSGAVGTLRSDVWECSFASSANGVWTQRTPTGTAPAAAWGSGYVRDANTNRLYISGGAASNSDTSYSNQFFYLDMNTTNMAWTQRASFTNARRSMVLGYDSASQKIILTTGYNGTTHYNDVQYYDIAGNTWTTATIGTSPSGRRSAAGGFYNGKMYVTHGRQASGSVWFGDTWELTPNYTTPNSSTWVNKSPRDYQRTIIEVTGIGNGSYHWQAWATEAAGTPTRVSYGGNAETAADFIIGTATTTTTRDITGKAAIQVTTTKTQTGVARIQATVTRNQNGISKLNIQTQRTQTGAANIIAVNSVKPKPAASADDAQETISSGAVTITAETPRLSSLYHTGHRFPNVAVPQGTVINKAVFRTQNYTSASDNNNGAFDGVTVRGHAVDNAPAFTTTTGDISNRPVTTASVTPKGVFESDQWADLTSTGGIDVTNIVQEILNRPGWASGNALAILFKGSGAAETDYIDVYHWDYFTGNQETHLEISWVPPAAPTTRDQTGIARITVTVTKNQTGISRITVTTTRTQNGVTRITVTTVRDQTGVARITATATRTQTGISRITVTTTRDQTGKSAILNTATRDQTGVARITAQATRNQTGAARITTTATRDQTGVARIQKTVEQNQTGVSRISLISTQDQTGKARIEVTTVPKHRYLSYDATRYSLIPHSASNNVGNNDNYAVVFYFRSSTKAADQSLSEKWYDDGPPTLPGYPWAIRGPYTDGIMTFNIYDGTTGSGANSQVNVADGQWHRMVGVRDYTNDRVRFYLDGVLKASATDTTNGNVASDRQITIGARSPTGQRWSGDVMEHKLYSGLLSDADVLNLQYGIEPAGATLIQHIKMNGVSGDTISQDLTANDNDLQVQTGLWGEEEHSGKAAIRQTVQRDQVGAARIEKVVTANQTGISRIRVTVDQVQTGISRIQITGTQNIQGLARITAQANRTIDGISRITAQSVRTIDGISRITISTVRDQAGLARITAQTTRDQLGTSRIQITTTRDQAGISRITAEVLRAITGIARITVVTTRTQAGVARVTVTAVADQTGKAAILKSTLRDILGTAAIRQTTDRTITGIAAIQRTTDRDQTGKAAVRTTTLQTIDGRSRITITSTQDIIGKAAILRTITQDIAGISRITITTTQVQVGRGRIEITSVQDQTGQSRIARVESHDIPGKARIEVTVAQNIQGISRLLQGATHNITGIAAIEKTVLRDQTGTARIEITTTRDIQGVSRITITTLRTQTGISRITIQTARTISGTSRITAITTQTQLGRAAIAKTVDRDITGIAAIRKTVQRDQLGIADILRTTTRDITGVGRVQVTNIKDQTGVSRITITSSRDITGQSRITITTTKDQIGTARVEVSTTRTQTGTSRITRIVAAEQTGIARVTAQATRDITGRSRIEITAIRDQLGKAAISKTVDRDIIGVSRITRTFQALQAGLARITRTFTGDQTGIARITRVEQKTIQGVTRITITTSHPQYGIARIELITSRDQQGVADILATIQRDQAGIAKVVFETTTTQSQQGIAAILKAISQDQTGLARITQIVGRDQSGLARITITTQRQQTGVARITITSTKDQTGQARIEITSQQAQPGAARITALATRDQTGISKITITTIRTIQGQSRITVITQRQQAGAATIAVTTTRTQTGQARITISTNRTITGVSRIIQVVQKTITGVANIQKRWYKEKPRMKEPDRTGNAVTTEPVKPRIGVIENRPEIKHLSGNTNPRVSKIYNAIHEDILSTGILVDDAVELVDDPDTDVGTLRQIRDDKPNTTLGGDKPRLR